MVTKTKIEWAAILARAEAAGELAAQAAKPTPMVVYETKGLSNVPKEGAKFYEVAGGVCGFATIVIKPARGALVTMLKAKGKGYKHYYGGYALPVHPKTITGPLVQSLEINEAYARAFVKVFREEGMENIGFESRMD